MSLLDRKDSTQSWLNFHKTYRVLKVGFKHHINVLLKRSDFSTKQLFSEVRESDEGETDLQSLTKTKNQKQCWNNENCLITFLLSHKGLVFFLLFLCKLL